jgi:aromatic ring-opening dioxygenase catalytic subunit (LigB family)
VPHNPHFPIIAEQDTDLGREVTYMYGQVADRMQACAADSVVFFTSDHYNIFFDTCVPIFSIGVADSTRGPSDYPDLPKYDLRLDPVLARHLQSQVVAAHFDVGMSQEFAVDHTVISPLHFLTPGLTVPVVPIFVSGFMRPLPTAQRCFEFGRALRRAIEEFPGDRRVAVVASGSISLEIGGPRIFEDHHTGVPDPQWLDRVVDLLAEGEFGKLVAHATDSQLARAGNAGGEILDWITMLGMTDPAPPEYLDVQPRFGHAFAAWSPTDGGRR